MTSPKAQSTKASKSSKRTTPTPAPQPSASEPIPYRPTSPTPTADAVREATAWIESAIIDLASVVSYIDSSRDDDPTMARESLADALDSLVAARIELNAKLATAVKVQS